MRGYGVTRPPRLEQASPVPFVVTAGTTAAPLPQTIVETPFARPAAARATPSDNDTTKPMTPSPELLSGANGAQEAPRELTEAENDLADEFDPGSLD